MPWNNVSVNTGTQPILETRPIAQALHSLGERVESSDAAPFGRCEFIYLRGVVGTTPGSVVFYDSTFQTTLAATASRGPVAVAMSANVANQVGWYMVKGATQVNTSAALGANVVPRVGGTAGQLAPTGTGGQVDGMVSRAATAGGQTLCQLSHPTMNGSGA